MKTYVTPTVSVVGTIAVNTEQFPGKTVGGADSRLANQTGLCNPNTVGRPGSCIDTSA